MLKLANQRLNNENFLLKEKLKNLSKIMQEKNKNKLIVSQKLLLEFKDNEI